MFIKAYSRKYAETLVPAGTLLICVQGGYLAVLGTDGQNPKPAHAGKLP